MFQPHEFTAGISNLVDDEKLVTMTLKEGFEVIHCTSKYISYKNSPLFFQLPADAYISVKTGTDDLLLCQRTGPLTALAADDTDCQWTVPLVTVHIHYGATAPTKVLDKLIEIQKAE